MKGSEVTLLLRCEGRFAADAKEVPWRALAGTLVVGCAAYGAVMGSFGLRPLQAFYSSVKVPLLLTFSSLVCLPSFYVVNTLLGLRDDFQRACRGILAAQATIGVTLVGLAPVTAFLYVSMHAYRLAQLGNGFLFAVATLAGQVTLSRHYAPLVARDPRHRVARRAWALIYVFVAIQTAWVLRPFIGRPQLPTGFLRENPWNNAYIEVARILVRVLHRIAGM